jgi:hypothetical protein
MGLASGSPAQRATRADTVYTTESVSRYLDGLVGPRAILRGVALAGFDQWRHHPRSYPKTWRGFEDRLGSRYGQVAISHTLRFGLSRAFEQRTFRYEPCRCGDSASRFTYAVLSPLRVITPHGVQLSALNPATEIASGILVTSVRPGGFKMGEGVRNGVTGLAGESLFSLVREFWPWKWRPLFL